MDTSHPAVRAVLEAPFSADLRLRTTAIHGDLAVAVVVENDQVRRTVIAEQRDGEWPLPTMIGDTARDTGPRPDRTMPWTHFVDHALSQSGWPDEDGERPAVAWQALTGIAAEDANAVAIATAHDTYESEVGSDGFFVTLARAAWGETPSVSVHLRDGDVVNVQL